MEGIEIEFFKNVNKTNYCWNWMGAKAGGKNGKPPQYGVLYIMGDKVKGKMFYAHRLSWMIHYGEMPINNLWVLHHCDNPPCVNPKHLWLGTASDNSQDRDDKGRGNRNYNHLMGENSHFAKLNEKQVLQIRQLYKPRIITMKILAEKFNIGEYCIYKILVRKTWKHI